MTKSFSTAIRWRVIILKETGRYIKAKRIAEYLFVGETFVRKILKLYEDTGGVNDIPRRKGKPRKITGNFMTDFHRKAFEVYL
jgi:transposase